MEEETKLKLRRLVKELESHRGKHTELVTVYVPAGYNLNLVTKQIETEKSTAQNIKSTNTRKSVLDALERIGRHLKLYKQTPPNGMAIFCGNISPLEGQEQIEIWAVEPPKALKTKLYRCDQVFVLEPLKEMLEVENVYGLVVIERKEATIGMLEGKNIKVLRHMTSGVPGKFKTGGQSSQRFHRIIEGMSKDFYKRIAEALKEQFFEMKKLRGIIVGGPGPTKEDFLAYGDLTTALKDKVIAVKDIGYADEHGLDLLVESSYDVLAKEEITKEKMLLERFFSVLATKPGLIAYGKDEVRKALESGAAKELLISTVNSQEEIDEFKELANSTSAEVYLVSEETEEGVQFRNIGGYGAILRFEI
nr:peptide chain release factor subunit 1 [uncultured archaeon]